MSLLDIVEEKYGTPVRGSKSSKSTQSPLRDLKLLKEPRPNRSELREGAGNDQADAPSGKLATATTHRLEWSDGTLVQSVDQWSKRLQESPDELRRAAGDDWSAVRTDPAGLVAFADLLAIVQIRESGRVPDTYTAITNCQTCASIVPIFEGCPPKVGACVWCMSGLTAPAIPRD